MKATVFVAFTAFFAALPAYAQAHQGESLGAWCDRVGTWRYYYEIFRRNDGSYFVRRMVRSGAYDDLELVEVRSNWFMLVNNDFGEVFSIDRGGYLNFWDDEGFIRYARRVRDRDPTRCFRS